MKPINFDYFYKITGLEYQQHIEKNGITNLVSTDVKEIKHNKNYYYKITNDFYSELQNKLINEILLNIPINNAAVAFRQGKSYLNLFEPHLQGYYFLRLDLKSFFHSISEQILKRSLKNYFSDEKITINNKPCRVIDVFISLITYKLPPETQNKDYENKVILPIGFKTSPSISNIIFRQIDLLIQKFCASKEITYTRYVDDMLFSSPKKVNQFLHSDSFYKEISLLLSRYSFKINEKKTIRATHTISLNGYTIQSNYPTQEKANFRVSNKKQKVIRKAIYSLKAKKRPIDILKKVFDVTVNDKLFKYTPVSYLYIEKYCEDQLINKLSGYRSYYISILKFDNKYQCIDAPSKLKFISYVKSIEKYLNKF